MNVICLDSDQEDVPVIDLCESDDDSLLDFGMFPSQSSLNEVREPLSRITQNETMSTITQNETMFIIDDEMCSQSTCEPCSQSKQIIVPKVDEFITEMTVLFDNRLLSSNQLIMSDTSSLGCRIQSTNLPVANSILWNRLVTRKWDSELRSWIRVDAVQQQEPFVLLVWNAEDLIESIHNNQLKTIAESVHSFYPEYTCIFLLEGIDKKLKQLVKYEQLTLSGRPPKRTKDLPSRLQVENYLIELEFEVNIRLHHSINMEDTCQWIMSFTKTIALSPLEE